MSFMNGKLRRSKMSFMNGNLRRSKMSFMNGKRYLNIEEATDVIMNHDFREAQIILLPPSGKGDITDEEDINEEELFEHTKEALPKDVSGEVVVLIKNVCDITSISSHNETSGTEQDIDFNNLGESHREIFQDDETSDVEIVNEIKNNEVMSSDSDFDDNILLTDVARDAVAKEMSRKTRSLNNRANKILDDVIHEVELKGYDMDIEERIFGDCSITDTDESTKESKNEEPPTKKRVFGISDIRFVPFKRKPKVIP